MHLNGVIHRDIKPENLLLDDKGYVRITYLGIARVWNPENSHDTSGTPGYIGILPNFTNRIAPEVLCRYNHGIGVDYFAVGVIAFEMMMGKVNLK
jgi:serine/threonine kinase 32